MPFYLFRTRYTHENGDNWTTVQHDIYFGTVLKNGNTEETVEDVEQRLCAKNIRMTESQCWQGFTIKKGRLLKQPF